MDGTVIGFYGNDVRNNGSCPKETSECAIWQKLCPHMGIRSHKVLQRRLRYSAPSGQIHR
ncbi:hypothetical protein TorRG33x02_123470 [Trema orientale]|uniref:Uncharacterized protein n=1 Tax=Trema orientale TaxID=63057 RepID=A0A2P5F1V2_TREOI|nr:hypothetical protein TorRG33x02_123470 [Trema orientale]